MGWLGRMLRPGQVKAPPLGRRQSLEGIPVLNEGVTVDGREPDRLVLTIRVRPYYLFYCDFAPGIDHFRTPLEKGAALIRDALQGRITGLAQPQYVVSTNIGKIPIPDREAVIERTEGGYRLRNNRNETTTLPAVPD